MGFSRSDPMVAADWLVENLSSPDLLTVDASWYLGGSKNAGQARCDYEAAHIPSAVFFDIDDVADHASALPHMLPDAETFASKAGGLGIADTSRLVIYDKNSYAASARAWWMFRAMGFENVRVLDGGWNAWIEAGGEASDAPTAVIEQPFNAQKRENLVKSLEQMASIVAQGSHIIFDARPSGRFSGESPEPRADLKSGHMPGARNVPAGQVRAPDGKLKSAEDLDSLFGDTSGPIVTSCGSGVTAAVLALALARLGRDDVAVYDGSWTEWGAGDHPIETGRGV